MLPLCNIHHGPHPFDDQSDKLNPYDEGAQASLWSPSVSPKPKNEDLIVPGFAFPPPGTKRRLRETKNGDSLPGAKQTRQSLSPGCSLAAEHALNPVHGSPFRARHWTALRPGPRSNLEQLRLHLGQVHAASCILGAVPRRRNSFCDDSFSFFCSSVMF